MFLFAQRSYSIRLFLPSLKTLIFLFYPSQKIVLKLNKKENHLESKSIKLHFLSYPFLQNLIIRFYDIVFYSFGLSGEAHPN